ncbi:formamidase [Brevibacillus laterosporus]|uniref:Formamidase n=1 Tax=Brevibacillus laterosporus TaxID=1465 RepID=A0A0F7EFV3_BRELA|nr:formamidase [Brevibacillus laterosporus]
MPEVLFQVDLNKPMEDQVTPGHNRWHPDIPATVSVNPGAVFRMECKDWTDGQIVNNDDPSDIRDINLNRIHVLSGPVWVNGAKPGDLLVVDILDIGAIQGSEWGFNGIFAQENGGGFLTEHYPKAAKSIWDFHGIYASSRHIPGVKFAGIIHLGLIGTAPSPQLLDRWNKRESVVIANAPVKSAAYANLPNPDSAILGRLKGAEFDRIAKEAARTVPPRENGGNCDIKNLSKGTRIYFPVFTDGAKLSVGDLHFSQGDGEISFCGGIEMAGWIDLHVDLIKGGMAKYKITENPVFKPGPADPHYSEFLVFEGISVHESTGEQYYLDAHLAYRRACLNAIEYLKTTMGYTGEQAYMLLSTAPVEGRISGIVDVPNACCTLWLPTSIFDRDILPK